MENSIQPEKPSKAGRRRQRLSVIGVLVVGTVMASPDGTARISAAVFRPGRSPASTILRTRSKVLGQGSWTWGPRLVFHARRLIPVLDELKTEYEGRLDVQFVDVWKMPDVANQYGVESIPTQIFFDASGKELYRHKGFFAKDEILSKWVELGVDLKK